MVVGGVSVAGIAAILAGALQVQDYTDERYVERQEYVAQSIKKQVESINVQIVQVEIQLEIIEQRQKAGTPRDGDATRYAKLLDQLKRLEAAREEMLRK